MFKTVMKSAVLSLVPFAILGCQSSGSPSGAAVRSPDPAVVCEQCKTTWIKTAVRNDKGHPVPFAYTSKKATVCPECKAAAAGYFATGETPTCKTCGGSIQIVKPD